RAIGGLKPYNEFGTFIPVNYRRMDGTLGDPGVYCLHLPVTTERARWGGVAIYGFPKIVADIEFIHNKDATSCSVWHNGMTIVELTVKKAEPKMVTSRSFCYTYKEGKILKTLVETEGLVGTSQSKGGAKIELGTHMISDELRKLNLGEEAVQYQYIPQMYSLLHKPSERLPA
ncbi:MAG: acetoacetate decarboxylase family protein, partial [Candidatus Bathyarchaeota archaeon]|nr:acetoacetate decarboxylase family protein [Candidatus Bathyarchaeota archaeon]